MEAATLDTAYSNYYPKARRDKLLATIRANLKAVRDEDEGYLAVVPDLAGCNAWGKTEAAAIREAHDAIAAWIKAAKSMKRAVPAPSKPADEMAYSGKFFLRVPKRLHADMAKAAKSQGVSLNQYVLYLLTERHAQGKRAA